MGAAYFYHLTRHPVDVTLAMLLGKAGGAGWRVAVRGADLDRLRWLDEKLWAGQAADFLPHGLAGGTHDADQPILLTTLAEAANNPQCVMCVDGAEITAAEIAALDRVCVLFDGNDDEALNAARAQWKTLKDAGASAQYWSQADGRWEKKAEM
ncbi:MAG: DNA polymerase-3 subunit chi [Ascidiaceihabitans sp.]|jgi:DNA polymerase-3 subunit chi|tara:strand:- start:3286 stop:3744 length:459 start_codon:yes stop_codon:yes gene_type:complete